MRKKDGNRVTKHSGIEEVFVIDSERFIGEKTRQPASVLTKFRPGHEHAEVKINLS